MDNGKFLCLLMTLVAYGCAPSAPQCDGACTEEAKSTTHSRSYILANNVYLRHRWQSSSFDYLSKDDEVVVHRATGNGEYLCVTAEKYGVKKVGWIISHYGADNSKKTVNEIVTRTRDTAAEAECLKYADHAYVEYYPCTIAATECAEDRAFRYGHNECAARIMTSSKAPNGYLAVGQKIGVASKPVHALDDPTEKRGEMQGYTWISLSSTSSPGKAFGTTGWVRSSAIHCPGDDATVRLDDTVFENEDAPADSPPTPILMAPAFSTCDNVFPGSIWNQNELVIPPLPTNFKATLSMKPDGTGDIAADDILRISCFDVDTSGVQIGQAREFAHMFANTCNDPATWLPPQDVTSLLSNLHDVKCRSQVEDTCGVCASQPDMYLSFSFK